MLAHISKNIEKAFTRNTPFFAEELQHKILGSKIPAYMCTK